MTRAKYILPNGKAITLDHIDFGLYTVNYNGKVLREFHCKDKAKAYFGSTITFGLARLRKAA